MEFDFKPAVNTLAPAIGMAVGAKRMNQQVGQVKSNILKSLSKAEVLSLTDIHDDGLIIKVM